MFGPVVTLKSKLSRTLDTVGCSYALPRPKPSCFKDTTVECRGGTSLDSGSKARL